MNMDTDTDTTWYKTWQHVIQSYMSNPGNFGMSKLLRLQLTSYYTQSKTYIYQTIIEFKI